MIAEVKEKKQTEDKRVVLFNDTDTYNKHLSQENRCFGIVKELEVLVDAILGVDAVVDIKELLENPATYLIEQYWNLWASAVHPPHTNRERIFLSSNNIPLDTLNNYKKQFDASVKALVKYAPEVQKKGLKSNLKQEMFDKYLNPEKAEEYYILKDFLKYANKLKKYNYSHDVNLTKYANGSLKISGLDAEINNYYFL